MSKVTKIIAGITACIISIGLVFYIINCADILIDLTDFSGEFYESIGRYTTFKLVISIIILIMSIVTIVISFVPSTSKKNALNCLLASEILIAIEMLVTLIWYYLIMKKYGATLNALSISMIAFLSVTIVCSLVALYLNQYKKFVAGSVVSMVGAIWLFVAWIIIIATAEDGSGMAIIYEIFMLISAISMLITYGFSFGKDSNKPVSGKAKLDNAEVLLKLKKLLDAGAITKEEYDQKRQKYVDSL